MSAALGRPKQTRTPRGQRGHAVPSVGVDMSFDCLPA